jgi:hypothetical protein
MARAQGVGGWAARGARSRPRLGRRAGPRRGRGGELGREAATRLPSWLGHVQGKWVRKKGGSWATPRSRPREKGGLFYFPFFL